MPKSHLVIYKMSFVPCIETEKLEGNPIRKEHIFYNYLFFYHFSHPHKPKKKWDRKDNKTARTCLNKIRIPPHWRKVWMNIAPRPSWASARQIEQKN